MTIDLLNTFVLNIGATNHYVDNVFTHGMTFFYDSRSTVAANNYIVSWKRHFLCCKSTVILIKYSLLNFALLFLMSTCIFHFDSKNNQTHCSWLYRFFSPCFFHQSHLHLIIFMCSTIYYQNNCCTSINITKNVCAQHIFAQKNCKLSLHINL